MGLVKEKELKSGVKAKYWSASIESHRLGGTTIIKMIPFLDKASKDTGKTACGRSIACGEINEKFPTGAEVYAHVKAHKTGEVNGTDEYWFEDAADDV